MLIQNMNQFSRFIDILPELEKDEVYFLSFSARNKYLNEEERIEYQLGRTEMFSREIARDKEGIYRAIDRMEISLQYRKTRNGKDIPTKCLVAYMNINPSSMINSFFDFNRKILIEIEQITNAFKNGNSPNYERLKRLPQQLNNSIQSRRSRKYFTDVDVDLHDIFTRESIMRFFSQNIPNIYHNEIHFILTKNGFHFLIQNELVKKFKLYNIVKELQECIDIKEINFNRNQMVPIPGTLQSDVLVTMI